MLNVSQNFKKTKKYKNLPMAANGFKTPALNDGETLSGLRILHFLNMVQTLILIFLKVHQRKTFLN